MTRTPRLEGARGMTLVEMMVALAVFSIVLAGALGAFRSQSRAFTLGSERMSALQNARFTANLLTLDLRTAGAGVPDEQPFLVYAGPDVIAFNANHTTNVDNDVFAVYYDPDAPTGSVTALTYAQPIVVPRTDFSYPSTAYAGPGGVNSPAETITFFFTLDSSTARPDDYALFRQVNGLAPELVARDLLLTPGVPFFEYYRRVTPAGGSQRIERVPSSDVPMKHSAPTHMSAADTGAAALIDSVRAVRLNFSATNGRSGDAERRRTLTRLVRLPNAGLATRRTCGDEPLLRTALGAVATTVGDGEPAVDLSWSAAADEAGGEEDVVRYVIWRRRAGDAAWGDPYLSIPAGNPSYAYTDAAVTSGETYSYALAAQDCTPSLSTLAQAGPVAVP